MRSSTGNVRSVCLVPTGLLNMEGKVLPNAHAFADLNDDSDIELIVGSMAGKVAVFKGLSSPEAVYGCELDGCITAIVAHTTPTLGCRLFVATAEGRCFVLQKRAEADALMLLAQFAIPLNVSAGAVLHDRLYLGTRDATIHLFNIEHVEKITEEKKIRVPGEVESMTRQKTKSHGHAGALDARPLVVCLNNGAVFELKHLTSMVQLQAPWPSGGRAFALTQLKSQGVNALDAFGCLDGAVELRHAETSDVLWSLQLPDALLMMATITLFANGDEEIALCCWNGDVYLVNKDGSQLRFTIPFSITAFFSGAFAVGGEDTLFCATTSGGILYYSGIGQSIRHIRHHSVLEAIETADLQSTLGSSEKRRDLVASLQNFLSPMTPSKKDEAPTLAACLRALVYAPNTILAAPPLADDTSGLLPLPPVLAPDTTAENDEDDDDVAPLPGSPVEASLLLPHDAATPPAPRTKKNRRKQQQKR